MSKVWTKYFGKIFEDNYIVSNIELTPALSEVFVTKLLLVTNTSLVFCSLINGYNRGLCFQKTRLKSNN